MTRRAEQVLQAEFLTARAKILELAASLDRLDRSSGSVASDPQLQLLHQGIEILRSSDPNRAERVQLLMSRPYDPQWKSNFQIS